jgi:TP901 family phage tail tape measure protein
MGRFRGGIDGLSNSLGRVVPGFASLDSAINSVVPGLGALGVAAIAAGGALAVVSLRAAIDFESSFAGVRKTVDATEAEFKELEKAFRDMATEIPVSVQELNRIGEAAGQLGIQKENIIDFTRTIADLGATTDLSSNEAATALARLANITQMSQDQFDELGSTVVALGNNLATTESQIVNMALRLAGAGSQVGLTEAQILSFAAALSSVGIRADAGGTAISRAFISMANAVASGGDQLEKFAEVANMTTEEFVKAFEEDAARAMISFIEGLDRISESGGNVFATLEEMELGEVRIRDALLRAAGAGDLFNESIELGNKAWMENTALTEEAEKRYSTTSSQLKTLGNSLFDIAITIGDLLLPIFNALLSVVKTFTDAVRGLLGALDALSAGIAENIEKMDESEKASLRMAGGMIDVDAEITKVEENVEVLGDVLETSMFRGVKAVIALTDEMANLEGQKASTARRISILDFSMFRTNRVVDEQKRRVEQLTRAYSERGLLGMAAEVNSMQIKMAGSAKRASGGAGGLTAAQRELQEQLRKTRDEMQAINDISLFGETAVGDALFRMGIEAKKLQLQILQLGGSGAEGAEQYEDALKELRRQMEMTRLTAEIEFEPQARMIERLVNPIQELTLQEKLNALLSLEVTTVADIERTAKAMGLSVGHIEKLMAVGEPQYGNMKEQWLIIADATGRWLAALEEAERVLLRLPMPTATEVPAMQRGGTVRAPGLALVGERGPELLSLPRGAQVNPLTDNSQITIVNNFGGQQNVASIADRISNDPRLWEFRRPRNKF